MPLAMKRYLACFAIIGLLMAVYSAAMTPLLQSPEPTALALNDVSHTDQMEGWWHYLFPPDAWQNQKPMVLQTKQGTLLYQTLTKTDSNDTLILSPLTLIVPISDLGRESVVGDLAASQRVYSKSQLALILAPEGAEIQFREALDLTSGTVPPVKEGKLKGQIQIISVDPRRPAQTP